MPYTCLRVEGTHITKLNFFKIFTLIFHLPPADNPCDDEEVFFVQIGDQRHTTFFSATPIVTMKFTAVAVACIASTAAAFTPSTFVKTTPVGHRAATYSSSALCMKYKVAVVGGGPSGACAAEIFAQEKGIDTVLFERKLDNAKPCGGAIPLCMVGEFNLPETVVDRKVCDE